MAYSLNDTFTGTTGTAVTSHISEIGGSWLGWLYTSAVPTIQSNRLAGNSGVALFYSSAIPNNDGDNPADYDVEAVLRVITSASYAGVCGRVRTNGSDHFYRAIHIPGTGWRLDKAVNGVYTTLGTGGTATLTVGQDYTLRLSMFGPVINLCRS